MEHVAVSPNEPVRPSELAEAAVSKGRTGKMVCVIINLTGEDITDMSVSHHFVGKPGEDLCEKHLVHAMERVNCDITWKEGQDQWDVVATTSKGTLMAADRVTKLGKDDLDCGLPVYVVIGSANTGFSVIPPKSQGTLDNAYQIS